MQEGMRQFLVSPFEERKILALYHVALHSEINSEKICSN